MSDEEKDEVKQAVKHPTLVNLVLTTAALCFGGGVGSLTTLGVLKSAVEGQTLEIVRLRDKVDHLTEQTVSRTEQQALAASLEIKLEKLDDRLRALERKP